MASNLIVARGGVEHVPPISLAFWRWAVVVLLLLPFTYSLLIKNSKIIKKEFKKLFFLGAMGCGVCGAFPFLAKNGNAPQTPHPIAPKKKSFLNSFLIIFEFLINNEYVKGRSNKTTTAHLQNANEIGGTCSTPPLATIKLDAIKIG